MQGNLEALKQDSRELLSQIEKKFAEFTDAGNQQVLCVEQKKILQLFSYNRWDEYMKWIDEKLEEASDTQSEHEVLSEIVEEEAELQDSRMEPSRTKSQKVLEESSHSILNELSTVKNSDFKKDTVPEKSLRNKELSRESVSEKNSVEKSNSQILAMENGKLRKENMKLQKKIQELSSFYYQTRQIPPIEHKQRQGANENKKQLYFRKK